MHNTRTDGGVPINRDMRGGDNRPRETRVNERIRAREVRVIDEDGQMLGVMTSMAALQLARERNLDLVEVSPMAVPPVCKILDWGRYKYEQSKKENEARKHQKVTQLREIRMRPRTDEHDVEVKVRKIQEFLAEGDKVKIMESNMISMIVSKLTSSEAQKRPATADGQPARPARPATISDVPAAAGSPPPAGGESSTLTPDPSAPATPVPEHDSPRATPSTAQ